MAARQIVLGDGQRERRVRRVADQPSVELVDGRGAIGERARPRGLPRVGLDGQLHRLRADRIVLGADQQVARRHPREPADHAGEIAQRLRRLEDEQLAGALSGRHRPWRRRGRRALDAARHDVELRRDGDAKPADGVVGDRVLRIPVAPIAVDVLRFDRDVDLFLLGVRLLIEDDALALDLLRLQPPAVDHREADDAIPLDRRRQVHEHAVLADDAKVEEPAVVAGHDAAHGERFGEPQGQCREREGPHPDLERRGSLDPHPIRRKGHLDVLTQDVVVDELVLAVEAPARSQLLRRGVDGDVPPPPSIEQRDVFRVLRRAGIGQAAEPPRPHFGEEIADRRNQRPAIAAQVAQVEVEGLADVVVEEVRGAAEIAGRDGHRLERRRRQHIVELPRPHPDEHRIELGRERILAAEDADLRALGGIRGRERHAAAAEQDDRGGPLGRFGDEGGTGGDFELEIRRLNGQVAQLELFRRIESELVQSADGGELLDLGDAARVSIPGQRNELGAPGGDGRLVPYSPKTSRRRTSPSGSSAARSRSLIMKRVGFGTASAANIRTPEASGVAPSAMTASTLPVAAACSSCSTKAAAGSPLRVCPAADTGQSIARTRRARRTMRRSILDPVQLDGGCKHSDIVGGPARSRDRERDE